MVCKPILKKLFIRKFSRNLLFKNKAFPDFQMRVLNIRQKRIKKNLVILQN